MRSRHSTRRCSPRERSGLESSKQTPMRNTGSAEHSAYASFLHLLAGRLTVDFVVNVRPIAGAHGGRAPHLKPESCSRWARGTLRIHAWRAALFQNVELQREILKFLFTRPELTHPL